MENEITNLFKKYKSDKLDHNYTNIYFSYFKKFKSDKLDHNYTYIYFSYFEKLKNEKLNILEIGVADGKSIRAWSDYFPNSTIIGIDIRKIKIEEKKLNKANIHIHQGSQSDKHFIKQIIDKYKKFPTFLLCSLCYLMLPQRDIMEI